LFERVPDSRNTQLVLVVAFILLALVSAGIFIKSPDVVKAEISINGKIPPQTLKAKSSGKLVLLVDSIPGTMNAGDYIACINNPANAEDVRQLKDKLLNFNLKDTTVSFSEFENKSLGELSHTFASFLGSLNSYRDIRCLNNEYFHNIRMLRNQIINDSLSLESYGLLMEKDLGLLSIKESIFRTDSILFLENAILESQMNNSKIAYLEQQKGVLSEDSAIKSYHQDIQSCRQKIENEEYRYRQAINTSETALLGIINELNSEILQWENSYVYISDVDGIVEFANPIGEHSFVTAGEPVFNINATNNEYYGIALMPSIGAGTVDRGQTVNIKIAAYPYEEYGMLHGTVKDISLNVNTEGGYWVYIDIPSGLVSTNGFSFSFAEAMIGEAEIITKEKRLIIKIFNRIYHIVTS